MSPIRHQAEVADGVFFVETDLVNWVILTDGDAVTLVDTGYPGQHRQVVDSIRATGAKPSDLAAILITHAHIDHIGSATVLSQEYGAPVYMHPGELAHARREAHHGLNTRGVVLNLWRPGMVPWLAQALRVGVTDKRGVEDPQSFGSGEGPLTVPGAPVPVHTPGHTPGHTAYWLPATGVVITGDALITGHRLAAAHGPQLLPALFDDDHGAAASALSSLAELPATTVLPGHGPSYPGGSKQAVALARAR